MAVDAMDTLITHPGWACSSSLPEMATTRRSSSGYVSFGEYVVVSPQVPDPAGTSRHRGRHLRWRHHPRPVDHSGDALPDHSHRM